MDTPNITPFDPLSEMAGRLVLAEWTAPIHPLHERSARWYLIGGILVLGTAVYGIVTGAWTLTLVTLLVGGLYFLIRREPPIYKHISIQRAGFEFDGDFTHWGDCKRFWIIHTPSYCELHIQKRRGKDVVIQTGGIDPTALRAAISQFLECTSDRRESLIDLCIRLCKL